MAWAPDDDGGVDRSWDQTPKGGWDAFRAARDVFLLGLAIDTALYSVDFPSRRPDRASPAVDDASD